MKRRFLRKMNNECGSVLILTVFLILVMTITAISAMTTSTTEVRIAGNEKEYNQCFYVAESGWQEPGQALNARPTAPFANLSTMAVTLSDTTLNRINNVDYAYAVKSTGNGPAPGTGKGFKAFYYEIKSSCDATVLTVAEPDPDIVVNVTKVYSVGY